MKRKMLLSWVNSNGLNISRRIRRKVRFWRQETHRPYGYICPRIQEHSLDRRWYTQPHCGSHLSSTLSVSPLTAPVLSFRGLFFYSVHLVTSSPHVTADVLFSVSFLFFFFLFLLTAKFLFFLMTMKLKPMNFDREKNGDFFFWKMGN